MQSYDLGFQQDQVLVLEVKAREARAKIPVLKNELLKLQAIKSIGLSGQIPGEAGLKTEPFAFESNEGDMVEMLTNYMFTGPDIISALDLQIQLGSNFNPEKGGANRSQEVIVNETLVKAMNWKDPIGKKVNLPIGEALVVGVIKDFHLKSLHHTVEPLTLVYLDNWAEALLIRTSPEDLERTVQSVGNIYKKVIPNTGFHYSFLDDRFARQYTADHQQAKLFMVFSVLTVAIACLGILGIVGFSLVRRSKEMSIRRVFGANYLQVIFLLMREYGNILLIGTLITIPLANYLAKEWLMYYPYKINLSVIHFALPVFGLILLIAAIIFARSYAAIRTNPAEVLKDE
jgi:putative ABC transport system permease protein